MTPLLKIKSFFKIVKSYKQEQLQVFQVRSSIDVMVYINVAKHVQRHYAIVEINWVKIA